MMIFNDVIIFYDKSCLAVRGPIRVDPPRAHFTSHQLRHLSQCPHGLCRVSIASCSRKARVAVVLPAL